MSYFRIGQIVPSSNVTMETEVPALFRWREQIKPDERFTFHSSRMRMTNVNKAELESMNAQSLRCAAELADAQVDVVSTACLVAIMAMGSGYHRQATQELQQAMNDNGCPAPAMTSAGALIEGLHTMQAKRIALLAPYMRPLTELVVSYIEAEGIEVVDWDTFEIADNAAVGRRDPMQLVEDIKRIDTSHVDVVVLSSCVQMPSLPAVQVVEDALGIPVTSTAICTARGMLDRLQLDPVVPGAGALLSGRYAPVAHADNRDSI